MAADAQRRKVDPGGQAGASLTSSAAGSTLTASSSEKSLPEPTHDQSKTPAPRGALDTERSHRRLHKYCGDLPPAEMEAAHYAQIRAQQPAELSKY